MGKKSWIQWGNGMDIDTRIEIDAVDVSGDKVVPDGSTWRKNPIPGCKDNGGRAKQPCEGPTFQPPFNDQQFRYGNDMTKGLFGYGSGRCMGNLTMVPGARCSLEEYHNVSFDFGIVDKVRVPKDLKPGEYVLSWRWDCEMTKQIWNSCSDITVNSDGLISAPFTPVTGCSACCVDRGICAECRKCVNDQTGECLEKCWTPITWWGKQRHWMPRAAPIQCLGHAGPDGRPGTWLPGMDFETPWSPGCERCWENNEAGCNDAEAGPIDVYELTFLQLCLIILSVCAFAGIGCFGLGRYCVKRHYARFTDEQDRRSSRTFSAQAMEVQNAA